MQSLSRMAMAAALVALAACGGTSDPADTASCNHLGVNVFAAQLGSDGEPFVVLEVQLLSVQTNFLDDLGITANGNSLITAGDPPASGGSNGMGASLGVRTEILGGVAGGIALLPDGTNADRLLPLIFDSPPPLNRDTYITTNVPGEQCVTIDPNFTETLDGLPVAPGGEALVPDPRTDLVGATLVWADLTPAQIADIVNRVAMNSNEDILALPMIRLRNGQLGAAQVHNEDVMITQLDPAFQQRVMQVNPMITIVETGITLDVRPTVSADRTYVRLQLRPAVQMITLPYPGTFQLGGVAPSVVQVPVIRTRQVTTNVMIPDGQTVVIGGLIGMGGPQQGVNPILDDLPVLGGFVRSHNQLDTSRALLIMVKPTIILN